MTGSLAQSLVDAAAEAARFAFNATVVGFVHNGDSGQVVYKPDDLSMVFAGDSAGPWEAVARAALDKALVMHADQLMATAAELYRVARDIREGR